MLLGRSRARRSTEAWGSPDGRSFSDTPFPPIRRALPAEGEPSAGVTPAGGPPVGRVPSGGALPGEAPASATPIEGTASGSRRKIAATASPRSAEEDPVALYDPRWFAFFHYIFTRFLRRHVRALRLPHWGQPEAGDPTAPIVVFANHPSWWDGVAFMLLAARALPERRMFIPMEAQALRRYGFMRRIGVFGIEAGSSRGAVAFRRVAERVLVDPAHALWMNAPGRFQDVRERPVGITPGLVRLAEIAPNARFLPLALEYPFWSERKPEMLAAFGDPIPGTELLALSREARAQRLRDALTVTMDRLAAEALSRDTERFTVLVQGQEGMGGLYDLWRHLRAALTGRRFDTRHTVP